MPDKEEEATDDTKAADVVEKMTDLLADELRVKKEEIEEQALLDNIDTTINKAINSAEQFNHCYKEHFNWPMVWGFMAIGAFLGALVGYTSAGGLSHKSTADDSKYLIEPRISDASACMGWCLEKDAVPVEVTDKGCSCMGDNSKTFSMEWQHFNDEWEYQKKANAYHKHFEEFIKDTYKPW